MPVIHSTPVDTCDKETPAGTLCVEKPPHPWHNDYLSFSDPKVHGSGPSIPLTDNKSGARVLRNPISILAWNDDNALRWGNYGFLSTISSPNVPSWRQ